MLATLEKASLEAQGARGEPRRCAAKARRRQNPSRGCRTSGHVHSQAQECSAWRDHARHPSSEPHSRSGCPNNYAGGHFLERGSFFRRTEGPAFVLAWTVSHGEKARWGDPSSERSHPGRETAQSTGRSAAEENVLFAAMPTEMTKLSKTKKGDFSRSFFVQLEPPQEKIGIGVGITTNARGEYVALPPACRGPEAAANNKSLCRDLQTRAPAACRWSHASLAASVAAGADGSPQTGLPRCSDLRRARRLLQASTQTGPARTPALSKAARSSQSMAKTSTGKLSRRSFHPALPTLSPAPRRRASRRIAPSAAPPCDRSPRWRAASSAPKSPSASSRVAAPHRTRYRRAPPPFRPPY